MTDQSKPELKPCPFCGGEAAVSITQGGPSVEFSDVYKVGCKIGACTESPWESHEPDAVAWWNRRAPKEAKGALDVDCLIMEFEHAVRSDERSNNRYARDAYHEARKELLAAFTGAPVEPQETPPSSSRYGLWKHMHDEHGLTLMDSELDEIVRHCSTKEGDAT